MGRLIALNLIICLTYLTFASLLPNKGKIDAYKELIKCTHEFCEEQNTALKALFRNELDGCLKKCNYGDKKMNALNDEERKNLKDCFRENNCKLPIEHIKQNRETPQFKALKLCAEEKCKEQFGKIKQLDKFDQQ